MSIGDQQSAIGARFAEHGVGAALTPADALEQVKAGRCDREHIALLRLVAPDLARTHAGFFDVDLAQFEARAEAGRIGQFRHCVRQTAGTDVVNRQDRVVLAPLPAGIDHLLAAALDLRVAALHRGKVEIGRVGAGRHRRGRTPSEADQHARTSELDQQGARRERLLQALIRPNVADATGDHDGLVVTAHLTHHRLFEAAEVAGQIRPPEFVVERGRSDRALDHDLQRRGNPLRAPVGLFPGALEAGNVQVRDRKTGQSGLRARTATGGTFVADLAAGASGRAWKRRNCRRMIVGLDLRQDVGEFLAKPPLARRVRVEGIDHRPFDHRGIVGIGDHGAAGVGLVGLADHAEQGLVAWTGVDHPVGIEDLVPAMLGIGLGEHHQFDVGRVSPAGREVLGQIVDLVFRQGEAERGVGADQRIAATCGQIDGFERLRRIVMEQTGGVFERIEHRLGHAVVQKRGDSAAPPGIETGTRHEAVGNAALDPEDLIESALMDDVGGLGRPRRDRSEARRHQQQGPDRHLVMDWMRVEQILQPRHRPAVDIALAGLHEIDEFGLARAQAGQRRQQFLGKAGKTRRGQGRRATQGQDLGHGRCRGSVRNVHFRGWNGTRGLYPSSTAPPARHGHARRPATGWRRAHGIQSSVLDFSERPCCP